MCRQGSKAPGNLTTYCQVIIRLLGTYASDGIVEMAEPDVTRCIYMDRMTEEEFGALFWKQALRCGAVLSVNKHKCMYIEGPKTRIHRNVSILWAINPEVELTEIIRYATSASSTPSKGNQTTFMHTKDTRNRGRPEGRTTPAVERCYYSLPETYEIPYVDFLINMAGSMLIEGGNRTSEYATSLNSNLEMDSGDN